MVMDSILQRKHRIKQELARRVQEQDTVASEKIKAGSLTSTNSTATATVMDTTDSVITQRTSDGVIERLDSLNFYPRKQELSACHVFAN